MHLFITTDYGSAALASFASLPRYGGVACFFRFDRMTPSNLLCSAISELDSFINFRALRCAERCADRNLPHWK
jgi:hypothetical protein